MDQSKLLSIGDRDQNISPIDDSLLLISRENPLPINSEYVC